MDAFWDKVDRAGLNDCWLWNGASNSKGYGNFRSRSAHVVAFELVNGPIARGLEIDHLCRVRACVNPAHLEAVTHQENVQRAQPDHCRQGHSLTGPHIKIVKRADGTRRKCMLCERIYKRKARQNAKG
jgi:hypothetical protein